MIQTKIKKKVKFCLLTDIMKKNLKIKINHKEKTEDRKLR